MSIWANGAYTDLEGDPILRGQRLDYDGASYGIFVGADQRLEIGTPGSGREFVGGGAFGFSRGDLDYRDPSPAGNFEVAGRFESELLDAPPVRVAATLAAELGVGSGGLRVG